MDFVNNGVEYTFQEVIQSLKNAYDNVSNQRNKIKTLRDKYLAHTDIRSINDLKKLYDENDLPESDVQALIDTAVYICNTVSLCLCKRTYNPGITAWGGITQLVHLARLGLQEKRSRIGKENSL